MSEGARARADAVRGRLAGLRALRSELDRDAGALHALHAERLHCRRGCSACCVDEITVFEVEAEAIRARFPELLRTGTPHPPGACAFLDGEGTCRIYEERPYVCRTQGLPLRWLDHDERVERRDICPLNEEGPPIESLEAEACWTLGPVEARLAALQAEIDGGEARHTAHTADTTDTTDGVGVELRRVALRDLFEAGEER